MSFGVAPENVRCIDVFFPGFTWKSFILWVSAVQAVVFVVSCIMGSVELVPTNGSLNTLGSAYGPCVQEGQVWRFVTPIFLHGNIFHLMFNVFFQMRMGFPLERSFGLQRFVLLYFAAGVAGNSLSMAWAACGSSVGASTSGFGLIGLLFAQLALQFHIINNRENMIFNIIMFAIIAIMFSIAPNSNIDWRGHLGGWLAGFGIGTLMHYNMENKPRWYQIAFYSAICSLLGLYISTITVIFAIPMVESRGCSRCSW